METSPEIDCHRHQMTAISRPEKKWIEIELVQNGRKYSALWSKASLRGTFSHGEFSVKYDLTGKRVSLRDE